MTMNEGKCILTIVEIAIVKVLWYTLYTKNKQYTGRHIYEKTFIAFIYAVSFILRMFK